MADDGKLVIYDVHGTRVGEATLVEGEVAFPDPEMRWTWVLDARHAPYSDLDLTAVLHRAEHARKQYALVLETNAGD